MSTTAPSPQSATSPEATETLRATDTLVAAFQATAAQRADEVALRTLDGATAFTFGQYAERVRSIAAGLAGLGLQRGDSIALLLLNLPEFHLVDTAAMHVGATPFSIYATSSPEQVAYQLGHAGARILITEQAFLPLVAAGRAQMPAGAVEHVVVIDADTPDTTTLAAVEAAPAAGFDFDTAWRAVRPEDVLTLIYTSGTTGPPKGVELTHAGTLAQWRGLAEVLPIRLGGRVISYLPAAHIADRSCIHYAQ
ncbi:MAG: AMP-binding protein, partial [Baekduiaceae bacterium]